MPDPKIHFLNVKQGDCFLIERSSERLTVIDICAGNLSKEKIAEARAAAVFGVKPLGNYGMCQKPTNPIDYLESRGLSSVWRFILILAFDDDGLKFVVKVGRGQFLGVREDKRIMKRGAIDPLGERDDVALEQVVEHGHVLLGLVLLAEYDDVPSQEVHDGVAGQPERVVEFLAHVSGGMESEASAFGIWKSADGIDGGVDDQARIVFVIGNHHGGDLAQFEIGIGGHAEIDDGFQAVHQLGVVAEEREQIAVGENIVRGGPLQGFAGFKQVAQMLEPADRGLVHAVGPPPHEGPRRQHEKAADGQASNEDFSHVDPPFPDVPLKL